MNGWVKGGTSPALRNPKKPRQQEAHSMTCSKLWVSKERWIICMRSAVTGLRCGRVESHNALENTLKLEAVHQGIRETLIDVQGRYRRKITFIEE